MFGHVGMEQDGLFGDPFEQCFQLFLTGGQTNEVVLRNAPRSSVLDGLDQPVAFSCDLVQLGLRRRALRVRSLPEGVPLTCVFLAEFGDESGVHKAALQGFDDEAFNPVLTDRQAVAARSLVAGRRAAVVGLRDLAEPAATAATLSDVSTLRTDLRG